MIREELKEHCEKQVRECEKWAQSRGEKPSGNIYEEHKLILELLQQQPCDDAVSRKAVSEFLENCTKDYEDARIRMAFMAASSLVKNTEYIPPVTPARKVGCGKTEMTREEHLSRALDLIIQWAVECDFGYDSIPDEYEHYQDEIKDMGYKEGLRYIVMKETEKEK